MVTRRGVDGSMESGTQERSGMWKLTLRGKKDWSLAEWGSRWGQWQDVEEPKFTRHDWTDGLRSTSALSPWELVDVSQDGEGVIITLWIAEWATVEARDAAWSAAWRAVRGLSRPGGCGAVT